MTTLNNSDILIMKNYIRNSYDDTIIRTQKDIEHKFEKINKLSGYSDMSDGLSHPSLWDIPSDRQIMQEEKPLQIAYCNKIIDDKQYIINFPNVAKFVVELSSNVSPTDIEEEMRVGISLDKHQIELPLSAKIDSSILSMIIDKPDISYDMIGGYKTQIKELKEIVEDTLFHLNKFEQLGINPPKGIHGPPGTGKNIDCKSYCIQYSSMFHQCKYF